MEKVGFGGGCHWCTEAVFQSLIGVEKVEQGWISSISEHTSLSEAVIVHFNPIQIDLKILTAIHLYTHSCTAAHPMRAKYRSAVYTFTDTQKQRAVKILQDLQIDFSKPIITKVLPFAAFKENQERYRDYYLKNKGNQFCENWIDPKLRMLREQFGKYIINGYN